MSIFLIISKLWSSGGEAKKTLIFLEFGGVERVVWLIFW